MRLHGAVFAAGAVEDGQRHIQRGHHAAAKGLLLFQHQHGLILLLHQHHFPGVLQRGGDIPIGLQLLQMVTGIELAGLADIHRDDLIFGFVHGANGLHGGDDGDFVFDAGTAEKYACADLHRISPFFQGVGKT